MSNVSQVLQDYIPSIHGGETEISGGRRRRHYMRGGDSTQLAGGETEISGGRRRRHYMRGGELEAGEIDGGDIQAGKRGRKIKASLKKVRSLAKKTCVKRSGSKSKIMQRIRSAKKSKKATKRRCSMKRKSRKM